jgi:hypothetical protein
MRALSICYNFYNFLLIYCALPYYPVRGSCVRSNDKRSQRIMNQAQGTWEMPHKYATNEMERNR